MQFNSAYPSVPILTAFLRKHGYGVAQADAGLQLILGLFSRSGLKDIHRVVARKRGRRHPSVRNFMNQFARYADTIDDAMRFLQNGDPELASSLVTRSFLPEGPRFAILDEQPPVRWRFDSMDAIDKAKYLASLYIDDIADVIQIGVDERFELSRYAEKLAKSLPEFAPLQAELKKKPTLIDRMSERLADALMNAHSPDLVGFTVPFPGNLYGALRMALRMKRIKPGVKVAIGGGYCNTELRSIKDPAIFDIVDYITLDDGEVPLLRIAESLKTGSHGKLVRTYVREGQNIVFHDDPAQAAPPQVTPVFDGMDIENRIGMMELPNPMYRLWSDGGWNKMVLAHGCYWHNCSFCDTGLDYIRRYRTESAAVLVDRIEAILEDTGQNGFHFVDEAAPPALLRAISAEILQRKLNVKWWCNIRFEKSFTKALARLMADAGCIAVTGGLETVCNRTLAIMRKGITVEQAVRVAANFTANGIMVHAYLMYGFPSQTVSESVDALEIVRQMFKCGCLQSAYWHRFALTVHSGMAAKPDDFGVRLVHAPGAEFAQNEIAYEDLSGADDLGPLAEGLRKAIYNFMYGVGMDEDVRTWFDVSVPRPRLKRSFVATVIRG